MAERHVRAVQKSSRFEDRLTRNILEILALDMGRDNSPAETSNREISARARCSVNTVRDRLDDILSSKEVLRERNGQYWAYTLNPQLVPYDSADETTREDDGLAVQFATKADIEAAKTELMDCINRINQVYQVYQPSVSSVSTHQRERDTYDNKEKEYIYINPDPEPVVKLKTKLSQITKTPYWEKTGKEYGEAVELLMGWDATPDTLDNFSQWWSENGWHPGLPEVSTVIRSYRDFLQGVRNTKSNGHAAVVKVGSR